MSSTDEVQLVFFQEVCDDVSPKNVTDSSFGFTPTFHAGIRISPKEIAEQPSIGYISGPNDAIDLLGWEKIGGQTSMHA